MENKCPFCSKEHNLRSCNLFNKIKIKCTKTYYIGKHLHINDENGFCAAGIVPYIKVKNDETMVLVVEQKRKDLIGLNFIGGRREAIKINGKIYAELPQQTAIREFKEEITPFASPRLIEAVTKSYFSTVFWSGLTKYVLYPVRLDITYLQDINSKILDGEIISAKWVLLNKENYNKFHGFTQKYLIDISLIENDSNNVFFN